MLMRVLESALDEGRKLLLVTGIETYFRLSDEDRTKFRRLLSRKEYRKMQDVELTWADELRMEGHEKDVVQGKREALKRVLIAKFGPPSSEMESRIDSVSSAETLDQYLDRVATATAVEDIDLLGCT